MERAEAYPITYSILGLLAFWGPMSGYDIKHMFDSMLAPIWGAAHSQIYRELRRMEQLEWVSMQREEQELRPDRKVYTITDTGKKALHEWQSQPPEVFQLRDELLLKVLFGTFASPDDLARNIRDAITYHEQRLLTYRNTSHFLPAQGTLPQSGKRPNPYAAESEADPYFTLLSRFAIDFEKTYLQWLYDVQKFLEHS